MANRRVRQYIGIIAQVDVVAAQMTDLQMGIFCLAGAVCTLIAAVLLILLAPNICLIKNKIVKAAFYYITIIMLLLDPLYLSVLCSFFGGGDMNGIRLLLPEVIARIVFGVLFIVGLFVFIKRILPLYKAAFTD